ncbi:DNA end-binding protein Ku [Filimonas lacunae]|uniref:Non-homologous end joining protein Ku n=1 Tax=Filimonas lacunae TaxID=477680 RepID=A0A173MEZ9_9BACT|nr:Ku protein [Filimonas lacunae]BAV06059.1 Ku domain protein [Filimonas lacunae]SIT24464.1 DNA end-binding protein Ku [Filimonas lacunae]
MRSLWKGAIGFGLVNIPVNLYSAIENSSLNLDMLDKKDHSRIHFKRVNDAGKEVPWKSIVKGYELNGKYVILEDKDFEKASPEKTQLIQVNEFANQEDIDPMLYETPYYLEPRAEGKKAYVLLRDAISKTGKIGVGTFVLRNKEHLCALTTSGNIMLLYTLRFPEEIRDSSDIKVPTSKTTAAEMKMAMALIANLTPSKFNMNKYKDTYTDALLDIIKKKQKGIKTPPAKLKVVHRNTSDLVSQLKASLSGKAKSKSQKKAS